MTSTHALHGWTAAIEREDRRIFQTYDKHRWRLGTLDEFLAFYNGECPNMSLDWDHLETPTEAFDSLLPSPAEDLEDPLATEVSTDE